MSLESHLSHARQKTADMTKRSWESVKRYPPRLWSNTKLFWKAFAAGSLGASAAQGIADLAGFESDTALNVLQYVSAVIPGYLVFFRDLYVQNKEAFPDGAFNDEFLPYMADIGEYGGKVLQARLQGEVLEEQAPPRPDNLSPFTPEYGRAMVDFITFDYVADMFFYTPEQVWFHDMLLDREVHGFVRGALANTLAATTYTVFGTMFYHQTKEVNDAITHDVKSVIQRTKISADMKLEPLRERHGEAITKSVVQPAKEAYQTFSQTKTPNLP